jgi:hypothetical protein
LVGFSSLPVSTLHALAQPLLLLLLLLLLQVGIVASRHDSKDPSSPLTLLVSDAPSLIKASSRQLSDKSLKTRMGMFQVLHTLVGVLPSSIADHVGMLVPGECVFALTG